MRAIIFCLIYSAIGFGVAIAYADRHNKPVPNAENGEMLIAVAVWPGFVAADMYRSAFPKPTGNDCR